jgi:hypothetical protein
MEQLKLRPDSSVSVTISLPECPFSWGDSDENMADILLSRLKWDRETANLIVTIRWGAGRKHQDITTQEPEIALGSIQ